MKKVIISLLKFKLTWFILNLFYKFFYRFKFEKDLIEIERQRLNDKIKEDKLKFLFKDLTVLNGPFKGMKYPDFNSHGSALFPKLLGSYESELHADLEIILKCEYDVVIDIGCAEGYYAVGIAMRMPKAQIYAYDLNEEAIKACREMSELNNVQDRINLDSFCNDKTLATFNFGKRGLIISDCEGYEISLFTPESVANLVNCDVLIELHDLYNEKISLEIERVFEKSHHIKKVYSESTFKRLLNFKEASLLSNDEINQFMRERNGIMAWALLTPKITQKLQNLYV